MVNTKQHKLTWFSKFILFLLILCILSGIIYILLGIYRITDTKKAIINDKLILNNGWYWNNSFNIVILNNYPNSFDVFGTLELQMCHGEIYKCEFIVKTGINQDWVIANKKAPTIVIPKYSLNSYVLDQVGCMEAQALFKPEIKTLIEKYIQDWLIEHTKNTGIIINAVHIYTPFILEK